MPSNHSQFMWFVCFYMVLFIRFRLSYSGETVWKVPYRIIEKLGDQCNVVFAGLLESAGKQCG
jgi:hypothetical protein